jgi:hypothetical protein
MVPAMPLSEGEDSDSDGVVPCHIPDDTVRTARRRVSGQVAITSSAPPPGSLTRYRSSSMAENARQSILAEKRQRRSEVGPHLVPGEQIVWDVAAICTAGPPGVPELDGYIVLTNRRFLFVSEGSIMVAASPGEWRSAQVVQRDRRTAIVVMVTPGDERWLFLTGRKSGKRVAKFIGTAN